MSVFTTKEAALELKISQRRIRLLVKHGLLHCRKFGKGFRFTDDDLNAFLKLTADYDLTTEENIRIVSQSLKTKGKGKYGNLI